MDSVIAAILTSGHWHYTASLGIHHLSLIALFDPSHLNAFEDAVLPLAPQRPLLTDSVEKRVI